jgi:antitoxin (DNA-binding transcriptional repressor) of toxin-antitoxin stability system
MNPPLLNIGFNTNVDRDRKSLYTQLESRITFDIRKRQSQDDEKPMSVTISLDEAQARLKDLINQLALGDEIIITENQQPIAKLVRNTPKSSRPLPGLGKGSIIYMSPDFDAPLDEFNEYTK